MIPIVRKGITATPIYIDFNGLPAFLIDASVFPGSSGSPVFICNTGSYTLRNEGLVIGDRLLFVGVLSKAFYNCSENVIGAESGSKKELRKMQEFVDLGVVYKPKTIIETIEYYFKLHPNVEKADL